MARKLKVFRTPIGFHDAYVAAPSRKAALEAWGADADLFARGVAEEVTDDGLMAEALADPGKVVRKVRGTMAEHLAALPADPERTPRAGAKSDAKAPSAPVEKGPRPDRNELAAAEQALSDAEDEHAAILADIGEREAALSRERREAERAYSRSTERLTNARDRAESRYKAALAEWRDK